MKTITLSLLIYLFTNCSNTIDYNPVVSHYNFDSIIESNKQMTDTFMTTQVEATENVKEIIEKIVYENKVLREKVKVVERIVIRDTIWIKESEQKNFWGKTKTEKEVTQQTDSTQTVTETIE